MGSLPLSRLSLGSSSASDRDHPAFVSLAAVNLAGLDQDDDSEIHFQGPGCGSRHSALPGTPTRDRTVYGDLLDGLGLPVKYGVWEEAGPEHAMEDMALVKHPFQDRNEVREWLAFELRNDLRN
eukprot:1178611-Prorocentrum_minimum.AAC.1